MIEDGRVQKTRQNRLFINGSLGFCLNTLPYGIIFRANRNRLRCHGGAPVITLRYCLGSSASITIIERQCPVKVVWLYSTTKDGLILDIFVRTGLLVQLLRGLRRLVYSLRLTVQRKTLGYS